LKDFHVEPVHIDCLCHRPERLAGFHPIHHMKPSAREILLPTSLGLAMLALVLLIYWPMINGHWLSDDVSNLYRAWLLAEDGQLWSGTLAYFHQAVDQVGAFYRPLMIASMNLMYALFGTWYPGWALLGLVVHLTNALLLGWLMLRLLSQIEALPDPHRTRPINWRVSLVVLTAAGFALAPPLVEGVVWVSARSDAWVLLLSLAGLVAWVGQAGRNPGWRTMLLPVCMLIALGFKESAVILAMQALLLALLWPGKPGMSRWLAVIGCFVLAGGFLGLRALLFGSPFDVYPDSSGSLSAITSLPAWWQGLFVQRANPALVWLALVVLAGLAGGLSLRRPGFGMGLALVLAGGGLALATLLNLGQMPGNGEGGRLSYGPLAWVLAGVGLWLNLLSDQRLRTLAVLLLSGVLVAGAWTTRYQVRHFRMVQDSVAELVAAMPEWVRTNPGLTILLVPDRIRFTVAVRNAQGGVVMRPLQERDWLHAVLPTLPAEIEGRFGQFETGLVSRLQDLEPERIDHDMLNRLAEPDEASLPRQLACWNWHDHQIHTFDMPQEFNRQAWVNAANRAAAECRLTR
jgi:hypothetical protein